MQALKVGNSASCSQILRSEAATCLVCGGESVTRWPAHFAWLQQCGRCGFQFVHPQPSDEDLVRIYDADYYHPFGASVENAGDYHRMKQAAAKLLLEWIEQRITPARLLDVGSALGDLLCIAQRRGWSVTGVESNAFAVEQSAKLVPGVTVCRDVDRFTAPIGEFSVITCLDVLEHLRRPDLALARFQRWLRPGGWLVITTIDVRSLPARFSGPRWVHYHRDHLSYFDRSSLAALAQRAGLEVEICRRARKVFHLDYLLRVIAHCQNFPAASRLARLGVRFLPHVITQRLFSLPEGLLLAARRPSPDNAPTRKCAPNDTECVEEVAL